MLPEKSFDTGELILNYAEGTPAGTPLVLLHGLTARWQYEEILARCHEREPGADAEQIAVLAETISGVAADTVRSTIRDQPIAGFDLAGALRRIQCPVLLLYGDWTQSAAMRDRDAEYVRANLPSAAIVKIPNGGYGFFQEQLETFIADPPNAR